MRHWSPSSGWAAVAAVWLVTLHTLYDVIQECEAFVKLRQQFLTKTEIMEDDPQATYSIMVERVPRECRADAALKAYFEHLFPGEVVPLLFLGLPCRGQIRGNSQGKDLGGFGGYLEGIFGNPSLTKIQGKT